MTAAERTIDHRRVEQAAAALFQSRSSGRTLEGFPPEAVPSSAAEGLAVQRRTTALLGARIAGWKVGLVPGARLTFAPIYANAVLASPAALPVAAQSGPPTMIEAEVAFRLAKELPRRDAPYAHDEVADAVETALAAIEVVQPRLRSFYSAPVEQKLADNLGNAAVIWGSGTRDWRPLDRARLLVTVTIDGQEIVRKVGGNSAGDPLEALVALANSPLKEESLLAGQVIITGSCTGMSEAKGATQATIEFAGLGKAEVRLA